MVLHVGGGIGDNIARAHSPFEKEVQYVVGPTWSNGESGVADTEVRSPGIFEYLFARMFALWCQLNGELEIVLHRARSEKEVLCCSPLCLSVGWRLGVDETLCGKGSFCAVCECLCVRLFCLMVLVRNW